MWSYLVIGSLQMIKLPWGHRVALIQYTCVLIRRGDLDPKTDTQGEPEDEDGDQGDASRSRHQRSPANTQEREERQGTSSASQLAEGPNPADSLISSPPGCETINSVVSHHPVGTLSQQP